MYLRREGLQNLPACSSPAPRIQDNGAVDQYAVGLDPLPKKTLKEVFLDEMNQVVPWETLVALIAPFARGAR